MQIEGVGPAQVWELSKVKLERKKRQGTAAGRLGDSFLMPLIAYMKYVVTSATHVPGSIKTNLKWLVR